MTELNVLRKNESASFNEVSIYDVTNDKYIAIDTTPSDRVTGIRFMDLNAGGDCCVAKFEPKTVIYRSQLTCTVSDLDEDYFALDLDALTYMEDCFQEVC